MPMVHAGSGNQGPERRLATVFGSEGSPWQNCFAERLIGSIRRECVDHVVALGEQHLRRVLRSYARYYNGRGHIGP